jgi:hypothetical protein
MAQDSFYLSSQKAKKILFHLLLQNYMCLRTDGILYQEKVSRVCSLLGQTITNKQKAQVAPICLYVAVRNTDQKGLVGEFILLTGCSVSSNATKAGTQGLKQKPQKSTATGLRFMICSVYFLIHHMTKLLRNDTFHRGLCLPKPINKCVSDMPSFQSHGGNSLAEVISSFLTLICVKLTRISQHKCVLIKARKKEVTCSIGLELFDSKPVPLRYMKHCVSRETYC